MADRFFLLVGLLRSLSVKRFSFVLHRRIGADQEIGSDQSIAILHVTNQTDNEQMRTAIRELIDSRSASLCFESRIAARLSTQKKGSEPHTVDFITDNVFIVEAGSEEELEAMIQSPEFNQILPDPTTYYAASLSRLL